MHVCIYCTHIFLNDEVPSVSLAQFILLSHYSSDFHMAPSMLPNQNLLHGVFYTMGSHKVPRIPLQMENER
jgi:hypothetical protein